MIGNRHVNAAAAVLWVVSILNANLTSAATCSFQYDSLHRLTRLDYDNGASIAYTYDAAGNRLTLVSHQDYTYITNNGTITITGYIGSGGDVIIPDTINGLPVTSIGNYAFYGTSLTSVTIGTSVTSIGDWAFQSCTNLTGVYFRGDAPGVGSDVFDGDNNATVYYLPGTTGWENFAQLTGIATVLWNPQVQSDASFGVLTNQFGFNITGSSNLVIVVEACTNLAKPTWYAVGTNTLTGGSWYFSDPDWTNYPGRFYRLRSP